MAEINGVYEEGSIVLVYEDPFTMKKQEGLALIRRIHSVERLRWDGVDVLVHECEVAFQEGEGFVFSADMYYRKVVALASEGVALRLSPREAKALMAAVEVAYEGCDSEDADDAWGVHDKIEEALG